MPTTPRLRLFAGPNGSGKSTLNELLPPKLLGVYLNADVLEKELRSSGNLKLANYGVESSASEALAFFRNSDFLKSVGMGEDAKRVGFDSGRLIFEGVTKNSYLASVTVEFLRTKLLANRASFTLESVMSHPSKIELLVKAQRLGYRTYLYFIATDDPVINLSRVQNRVKLGGHDVPPDKIVSRYSRSLDLLVSAIRHTNRAYIFDNSGEDRERSWLAEVTDGATLELRTDEVPAWFKRWVLDRITQPGEPEP